MSVERLMEEILIALPEISSGGSKTIREVCLTYNGTEWEVLAGGHFAVHIGEWGGDFRSWGITAEVALTICLRHIRTKNG